MNLFKKIVFGVAVMGLMGAGNASAAGKITLDGSTTVGPIAKAFASYYKKSTGVDVTVSESGSGNGAKSLINKTCDIANMSRAMKDNELAAARSKGVNPVEHVVALDGIAIIVHPGNRVSGLSRRQIRDIYSGKVTNWSAVGGPNAPIVMIQRESNSGTQDSFKSLVMGKEAPISKRSETQASNGAVKSRVASTPTAVGFVGLGYVDSSVKALNVDGIAPTVETVKNGSYPVARPLFMYTNGQPTGNVAEFINLNKTPEGKKIISEIGFVNNY
ncbi:phosphate ABC transporter substrate-binding protein [Chlorobaculum sp. 24CR]|uniref:phosphate ABC transporter substrate-binding protein n=1 Tax=Chlorobaculum sp. 24CR TaxID=2508878 RepID=UPI00100BC518|nr:phosphate ABC transporter substrate-binding protein [Chlorobaculum sp. 24CR]RXK87866.1 phosphate ABC transporter substrate-binding protein [Chlorobaculum sp. 24CR]